MTPSLRTDTRTADFAPRVEVSSVRVSKLIGRVYFDIDEIFPLANSVAEHEFKRQIKPGERYMIDDFSNLCPAEADTPDSETRVEHFTKWDEGIFDSVSVQDDFVTSLKTLDGKTGRFSQRLTFRGLAKSGVSFR